MTTFLRAFTLAAALLSLTMTQGSAAKTVEFDEATIAELNAALTAGTLTCREAGAAVPRAHRGVRPQGPALHAVSRSIRRRSSQARALDAERKAKGPRSPLHGIPVVLKDNFDTFDMPTTGGSVLLEGSIPPDDAFVVKKLRDAGAIILAKVNLSEFASGGAYSSLGGQIPRTRTI